MIKLLRCYIITLPKKNVLVVKTFVIKIFYILCFSYFNILFNIENASHNIPETDSFFSFPEKM